MRSYHVLAEVTFNRQFYKDKNVYENFLNIFKAVVTKHAPMKSKILRGNNAPFMTKELRKAVMNRSRLKKKYQRFKNWKERQKNKCKKLFFEKLKS